MVTTSNFFHAITNEKDNEFTDGEFEKDYSPFLINMSLSHHPDCAIAANEMNIRSFISNKNQYRFLNIIIPKRKRHVVWKKSKKNTDISIISDYYKISIERAEEYYKILSDEQINELAGRMCTGGRK